MARVRWIAEARFLSGVGTPTTGQVYEWPDDLAADLIAQGRAEAVKEPPAPKPPKGLGKE